MSLAYGIVQRHSGTIALDSQVGRGTTFTITLPQAVASGTEAEGPGTATTEVGRGRLLVIDDEPELQQVITGAPGTIIKKLERVIDVVNPACLVLWASEGPMSHATA